MLASRPKGPRGFTLIELLVVIAIIGLISAVALPVVLPALNERRVSEAARQVQAILGGARDAAIRANANRGIRLLPDPVFNGSFASGNLLASNRIIPIEPAPDYSEGLVVISPISLSTLVVNDINNAGSTFTIQMLRINEVTYLDPFVATPSIYSSPTSWFWNIRQGDKIRFSDSGQFYTIAGPMQLGPNSAIANNERFLNTGVPTNTFPTTGQFLYITNGVDDNGNGYVDEAFDGIDNDGDGIIDPLFNGLDDDGDGIVDNETSAGEGGDPSLCDTEAFEGSQYVAIPAGPASFNPLNYVISRRPVVSPGARETTLPAGVVIDMTTWNAPMVSQMTKTPGAIVLQPERSRLPVDPYTYYVDIMISPGGQVIQGGAGSSNGVYNALAPQSSQPFYHFWLTERQGVQSPLWQTYGSGVTFKDKDKVSYIPRPNPNYGATAASQNFMLPMPQGTPNYLPMADDPTAGGKAYSTSPVYLTGERRLVTLFVKTGQIVTNSIETFNGFDTNQPFYDAQAGVKESQ